MYNLQDNMIGGYYPFFMTNEELGDTGYVYQITTPSYNKTTLRPYISLTKVCDKTFPAKGEKIISRDNDILFYGLEEQYRESLKDEHGVVDRSKINWVGQVRRAVDIKGARVIPNIQKDGFPLIEITGTDLDIQKNLILNLRNNFRWKRYKIKEGNKIDVLWTKTTFMVFDIREGDDDSYRLVPCGLYRTTDISLTNNLLPENFTFESQRYSKKASEFLIGIKRLEERFLDRGEIIH